MKNPLQFLSEDKLNYDLAMKLNCEDTCQIPELKKVVVSFNAKDLQQNYLEDFLGILELLSYQKPIITRSKKPVIHLKIRENQIMGFKTTLRNKKMFQFLLKFFSLITPRYPFFVGHNFKYSNGSISFTYRKLTFFHELELDPEYANNAMFPDLTITLHTTAKNRMEMFALLRALQIPCIQIY